MQYSECKNNIIKDHPQRKRNKYMKRLLNYWIFTKKTLKKLVSEKYSYPTNTEGYYVKLEIISEN